jgi:hypothetical protein
MNVSSLLATQATGEPVPLAAGFIQNHVISGLDSSTTYYFAIKTADEVPNWSGISNSPSDTTSAGSGSGYDTEEFGYDFLDRLTSVSDAYSETYTYNQIGNLLSKNNATQLYTDSNHKHAVTASMTPSTTTFTDTFETLNGNNWTFNQYQTLDSGSAKNTGTGSTYDANFYRSAYNINGGAGGQGIQVEFKQDNSDGYGHYCLESDSATYSRFGLIAGNGVLYVQYCTDGVNWIID